MLLKSFGVRGLLSLLFLLFSSQAFAIDFGVTGYYRFRSDITHDLDTQTQNTAITHNNDRFGVIQYNQMRMRLAPKAKINDFLSIHSEFDFFDNLVFGSKANKNLEILSPVVGTLTLPSGAGTIGEVGGVAGENEAVHMRRAWMEILSPIGKFKIGRQPSHWGLGIFQNDGDGRHGDFGDSQDRILFLTQMALKNGNALTFGFLWDIPFEAQFDPRIQGLGGSVRGNGQDSKQLAGILMFDQPDFTIGMFAGSRFRSGSSSTTTTAIDAKGNTVNAGIDGDTLLFFSDIFMSYTVNEYTFRLEGVYIGGDITTGLAVDAIPFSTFSASGTGAGVIELPPDQGLRVIMAAFEMDAFYDNGLEWNIRMGYASGDETPLSTRITQYGFRPDYQVALMMFNRPLGTSPSLFGGTANSPGSNEKLTGGVPITGNFINNAVYLGGGLKKEVDIKNAFPHNEWFKIGGRILTAWAPMKNVNLDFAALLNNANLPALAETGNSIFTRWYGGEIDLIAEGGFFEHLYTALELGILVPGRSYNIDVNATDPGNIIDPVPVDKASIALAGRVTAMIEF